MVDGIALIAGSEKGNAEKQPAIPAGYVSLDNNSNVFPGCLVYENSEVTSWRLSVADEWYKSVAEDKITLFAKPQSPQDFEFVHGNGVVEESWLVYRQNRFMPVPPAWLGIALKDYWHTSPNSELNRTKRFPGEYSLRRNNAMLFRPRAQTWRTAAIPPEHRTIYPGEVLKRTDLIITEQQPVWATAGPTFDQIKLTHQFAEHARFARWTGPNWNNWYIDTRPGRGNASNSGLKLSDALCSIASLEKRLKAHYIETGIRPAGMAWDRNGNPIKVYDASDAAEVPQTSKDTEKQKHSILWLLRQCGAAGELLTKREILSLAEENLPIKYRLLTGNDIAQEHDLVWTIGPCGRLPMMWLPVEPSLWGRRGEAFLFARHEDCLNSGRALADENEKLQAKVNRLELLLSTALTAAEQQ